MEANTAKTGTIDVRDVARLARLGLTDDEAAVFQGQLAQVVEYIAAIKRLDLTGIEPTSHAQPLQNVLRADVERPSLPRADVMRNAPASREGLFAVPKIVE